MKGSSLIESNGDCSIHKLQIQFICIDQGCSVYEKKCCSECFVTQGSPHRQHQCLEISEVVKMRTKVSPKLIHSILNTENIDSELKKNKRKFVDRFSGFLDLIFDKYLGSVYKDFTHFVETQMDEIINKTTTNITLDPRVITEGKLQFFIARDIMPGLYAASETLRQSYEKVNKEIENIMITVEKIIPKELESFQAGSYINQNLTHTSKVVEQYNDLSVCNSFLGYSFSHVIEHPGVRGNFLGILTKQDDPSSQGHIVRGNLKNGLIEQYFKGTFNNSQPNNATLLYSEKKNVVCASSHNGKAVYVFDVEKQELISEIQTEGYIYDIGIMSDSVRIITGEHYKCRIGMLSLSQMKNLGALDLPEVHAMVILPENKITKNYQRVYVGDSLGNLRILCVSTVHGVNLENQMELKVHQSHVTALTMLQDGLMLTGGMDNEIKLVDLDSLGIIKSFQGHQNYIQKDIIFISSIASFLAFDQDKVIKRWNIKSGQCEKSIKCFDGQAMPVGRISILAQSKVLVVSYDNFSGQFMQIN